jgi:prephenate dehydrogenase
MSHRKVKPKMFKNVAIIGVGLIGGSLGLAMRRSHIATKVIGFFRKKKSARLAKKLGIVDKVCFDLSSAVRDADLVILAAPVEVIKSLGRHIAGKVKRTAIVMDVGSTKKEIIEALDKPFTRRGVSFIGTHPLAGSEKSGLRFANPKLFQGSLCFIIKTKQTDKRALAKIKSLWSELGAKIIISDAFSHDCIVAAVSHLPHMVSFALMNSLPVKYLQFSGSGLRDCTRLASSESAMWEDICLSNRAQILKALKRFKSSVMLLERLIAQNKRNALHHYFLQAKQRRDNL